MNACATFGKKTNRSEVNEIDIMRNMDEIDDLTNANEFDDAKNMDEEVHDFQKNVALEIFLSIIVTIGIFFVSFLGYLPWKIVAVEGQKHVSLNDRFIFTLQLAFIDILPLIICVFAVSNRRRETYAINPMDPRGKKYIEGIKGILENTFEQFVIKLILSFILCVVLLSHELLLLPIFTLLFIIGRFTFVIGYPTHRSFGMTMNFVSILLVTILIAYRLLFKRTIFLYIYWK